MNWLTSITFHSVRLNINKNVDFKGVQFIIILISGWWHSMRSSWCPSASWWSSQVEGHKYTFVTNIFPQERPRSSHRSSTTVSWVCVMRLEETPTAGKILISSVALKKGTLPIPPAHSVLLLTRSISADFKFQDNVPWVATLNGGSGLQSQLPWICQKYHLQGV